MKIKDIAGTFEGIYLCGEIVAVSGVAPSSVSSLKIDDLLAERNGRWIPLREELIFRAARSIPID